MPENKLGWARGSIDTILAGGESEEPLVKLRRDTRAPRYDPFTSDELARASTEELLLELRRQSSGPATDAAGPGTTGTASTQAARRSSDCLQSPQRHEPRHEARLVAEGHR